MTTDQIPARFGRLATMDTFVLRGRRYATCRCDCGTVKAVRLDSLSSGRVVSCGCAHRDWLKTNSKFVVGNTVRPNQYARGPNNGQWKGDSIVDGHDRCRSLYPDPLGQCERDDCSKLAVDRHHRDGNSINNDRSNVMFVCRGCHQLIDGRMAARVEDMRRAVIGKPATKKQLDARRSGARRRWREGRYQKLVDNRGPDGRWRSQK